MAGTRPSYPYQTGISRRLSQILSKKKTPLSAILRKKNKTKQTYIRYHEEVEATIRPEEGSSCQRDWRRVL